MSHNVLVGGFASSERQIRKVAEVLAVQHDEEYAAISFREAMEDPVKLDRLARRANIVTHSAGMMAIRGTRPESIDAIAPPVPVWAPLLAARAIASGAEFVAADMRRSNAAKEVSACVQDAAIELGLHLHGNLRWLGDIAVFDALTAAAAAKEAGIAVGVAFMANDKLFRPRAHKLVRARQQGVKAVVVPGVHEDFIQNPGKVMEVYETGDSGVVTVREARGRGALPPVLGAERYVIE